MAIPTRFPSGVSTDNTGEFRDLPVPHPCDAYVYFNDFIKATDYSTTDWTLTTVEVAGTASEAIAGAGGGHLVVTNGTNEDDYDSFQLIPETFKLVAAKKTWFRARMKVSDATQSDFLIGLVITDTDPMTSFTDGIVFKKDDGDTNLDFSSLKDSAGSTATAIHTVVDDTFMNLGFYFDGVNIEVYVNGNLVKKFDSATFCDNEDLAVTFHIQNGAAAAKVLTLDYIYVAQER